MNVYAETSAVVAWLYGEPQGAVVRQALTSATHVLTSEITLVECDRVMVRAWALGGLDAAAAEQRARALNKAAARWVMLQLEPEVLARARQPFPVEPLRTLDALHLASAAMAARAVPELALLSLDPRLRSCAQSLGLRLEPETLDAPGVAAPDAPSPR